MKKTIISTLLGISICIIGSMLVYPYYRSIEPYGYFGPGWIPLYPNEYMGVRENILGWTLLLFPIVLGTLIAIWQAQFKRLYVMIFMILFSLLLIGIILNINLSNLPPPNVIY